MLASGGRDSAQLGARLPNDLQAAAETKRGKDHGDGDVRPWLLMLVESDAAGRAYAAYGGVYIAASLGWFWAVEGLCPDRWDITGVAICLVGATVILLGPRAA